MPFKSQKQERFMFSQHPQIAQRWAKETPSQENLPTYAKPPQPPTFSKLHEYFDGGDVKKDDGPTPEQLKALAEVHFQNGRLGTNLDPNIVPVHNSKNDPSLELEEDRRLSPYIGTYKNGGMVPGKPKVPYNSPQNDTVKAKLTPHEVVLPLSVTQAPDAPDEAKKYMLLHHYFGGGEC